MSDSSALCKQKRNSKRLIYPDLRESVSSAGSKLEVKAPMPKYNNWMNKETEQLKVIDNKEYQSDEPNDHSIEVKPAQTTGSDAGTQAGSSSN